MKFSELKINDRFKTLLDKYQNYIFCKTRMYGETYYYNNITHNTIDIFGNKYYFEENEDIILLDNPDFDCTPHEHPAYTRGVDHCMDVMVQEINNILNRKDKGAGITNHKGWNELRRRLIKIANDHDLEIYNND